MSSENPPPRPPVGPPSPGRAKTWVYRGLAAVGVPLVLVLALEAGLRLAGYGRPATFFVPDDRPGYVRTNEQFTGLFLPESFDRRPLSYGLATRKPAGTLRVVILGESVARGTPVSWFAFGAQLRALLRARHPDKDIEIVNTGIVAINSHVVYQIARDVARYSPDLFVVYLGNNEVVGPYSPGCSYLPQTPPLWIIRLSVFVRSTRTGQLLGAALNRIRRGSAAPREWGGMEMFVRNAVRGDDPRLEAVYRNFEANLRDILAIAQAAGAPTLLCTPAGNLKDCAPFLSLHRADLGDADRAVWQHRFDRGRIEWLLGENAAAHADLTDAWRLDPQYADTAFLLGSLELQAGDVAAARGHLLAAQHWDALRFRPDPRINEIVRRVAADATGRVTLVDAAARFGSDPDAMAPPPGREVFFEHVHLDWEGNYRLARWLAEAAEPALYGPAAGRGDWLDSAGVAAALAYTPHERPFMLLRMADILRNPPFDHQVTYWRDQAIFARELAEARAKAHAPETLRQARTVADAALAADPGNPDLAHVAAGIADDLGDAAGALALARRSRQLQSDNFALACDEALRLAHLGRVAEAEKMLREKAGQVSARDRVLMAPAFTNFFLQTKRYADGRAYLESELEREPGDRTLRLSLGQLAEAAGDTKAAEKCFRDLLADEPEDPVPLQALVVLLDNSGRTEEADAVSLASSARQPGNQANHFRAARVAQKRGDSAGEFRELLAAAASGPVTAEIELRIAWTYFGQHDLEGTLTHLAKARQLAELEGDSAMLQSVRQILDQVRSQLPQTGS